MRIRARGLRGPEGAGRALRLGVVLLLVAGISAVVLAGLAHAAPDPTPGPTPGASPDPSGAPAPEPKPERDPELSPTPTPPANEADKSDEEILQERREAELEREQEKARTAAQQEAEWKKKVADYKKRVAKQGGVLGAFSVTDRDGIPAEAYEVVVDSGGFTDVKPTFQEMLIEGLFSFTKWLTALGCWVIMWALSWSLAAIFFKPAMAVSDALYNQAIVQLGLPSLLLTFSGVVACWHIFFGSRSRGWGEIAASTIIAALAVTTFAAPPQLLLSSDEGAVGKVRELGLAVGAIVLGQEDALTGEAGQTGSVAQAKKLTRPITNELVDAFIVKPSMLLTYNQVFTGKCADAYAESRIEQALFNEEYDRAKKSVLDKVTKNPVTERINIPFKDFVASKAFDFVKGQVIDKEPSEKFEEDCVKGDAGQAKKASWDKVGGAFFVMIAAFLVFLLLGTLSCGYLAAQAWLAVEAMLFRVALAAGILPGPGRAWLWERGVKILRLLGALIAIVVGLAIFILVITTVLTAKAAEIPGGLTVRFVLVDLLCIAAFFARKRLAARGRAIAADMRTRMGSGAFGGREPAQITADGAGRRSIAGKIARTGLVLGAMAATGGTSSAATGLARSGTGSLSSRLATRAVRRGGRGAARRNVHARVARIPAGPGGVGTRGGFGMPGMPRARQGGSVGGGVPLWQRLQPTTGPAARTRQAASHYRQSVTNRLRAHRGQPPVPFIPPPPPHPPAPFTPPSRLWRTSTGRTRLDTPPPRPPSRTSVPPSPAPPPGTAPDATGRARRLQNRLHRARYRNAQPASPFGPRRGRPIHRPRRQ